MSDEGRFDPHGVGNLPHILTIKKVIRPHSESGKELNARFTDVLKKFQSISGYNLN